MKNQSNLGQLTELREKNTFEITNVITWVYRFALYSQEIIIIKTTRRT